MTPQTYLYDQEPSLGATTAAIQNDQIASLVKAYPDRFMNALRLQTGFRRRNEKADPLGAGPLRGSMLTDSKTLPP